jgi:transcriptional regulator with XRE-family HTH domain
VDKILERLKDVKDDESRYAYADAVTNTFLTGQIKALQKARGLTQEELAERVRTQQSGISRWMNSGFSTCKVETLRKFARAYGVRLRISFEPFGTLPADIVGFTEDRLAPPKFEDDPAFKERTTVPSEEALMSVHASAIRRYLPGERTIDSNPEPPELKELRNKYFEKLTEWLLKVVAS